MTEEQTRCSGVELPTEERAREGLRKLHESRLQLDYIETDIKAAQEKLEQTAEWQDLEALRGYQKELKEQFMADDTFLRQYLLALYCANQDAGKKLLGGAANVKTFTVYSWNSENIKGWLAVNNPDVLKFSDAAVSTIAAHVHGYIGDDPFESEEVDRVQIASDLSKYL